jgi:simple sugar transport system ATP-binding protein
MSSVLTADNSRLQNENIVYMENICVKYGKIVAIEDVSIEIGRNEILGLLGDNGAGKTTLANTLVGVHKPSSGKIYFEGKPVRFKSPNEARNAGIEMKSQDLSLVDSMSVVRNFFIGKELSGQPKIAGHRVDFAHFMDQQRMEEIVWEQLTNFGIRDGSILHRLARSLSGGERQLIAIARAIYFGAKLLILDEPSLALSEDETVLLLKRIRTLKDMGVTVIFITHKANEVFQVADRFVVLQNGKKYADFMKEDTNLKDLEKLMIYSSLTAMRELAASVAHQISNPLTIMKISVEMLKDYFDSSKTTEEIRKIPDILLRKLDLQQSIVSNFLDFARPLKTQKQVVPVKEIVESSLINIPHSRYKDISVEVLEGEHANHRALVDKDLLEQAITNLVLNALEVSKPHGKIEIKIDKLGEDICIDVQDYGIGIDEGRLRQIFNYFYTTKKSGSGLGLPIAQRIVERHNGTITVVSKPNRGSVFRIKIPSSV